jgi:hypothetical protein
MYCRWRSSYEDERVGIPLTGLTPPHYLACPKSGPGLPTPYVVVCFVFSEFRKKERLRLFALLILEEVMTSLFKLSFYSDNYQTHQYTILNLWYNTLFLDLFHCKIHDLLVGTLLGHCIIFLRFTASDYPLGILKPFLR